MSQDSDFYDLEGSALDLDEAFYDLPPPPQLGQYVVDEALYDLDADLPPSDPLVLLGVRWGVRCLVLRDGEATVGRQPARVEAGIL